MAVRMELDSSIIFLLSDVEIQSISSGSFGRPFCQNAMIALDSGKHSPSSRCEQEVQTKKRAIAVAIDRHNTSATNISV
ncbi:hypothetical protein H634G_08256 [Metarhizium anisopliae BRIP 53293]|uniref:Uncharacterized protein n=1 Tax=Metarhizium anisopliae BRIP 53293 TaxID=1291518 RepID=A0A0D9NUT9_METAN|nr:hypothetical protein H634G_08256 [Metarhizium anisopliae BRIP 53293]KJK94159.1 hypothetical protein H633G_01952 [Metarhizium anisopliae BRIP 53284]